MTIHTFTDYTGLEAAGIHVVALWSGIGIYGLFVASRDSEDALRAKLEAAGFHVLLTFFAVRGAAVAGGEPLSVALFGEGG